MTFRDYWMGLGERAQANLAAKLGTSKAYCIQLAYGARIPSLTLAFAIRDASKGKVSLDSWPRKRRVLLQADAAALA